MKLRVLSAIFITILFVYLLLPSIDIDIFIDRFENIFNFELTLGFMALVSANFIRTARFRTMDVSNGKFFDWWHINQTYNVVTMLLPGGGGEIATAYIMKVNKKINGSIFCAIRTLVRSRLMDLLFYAICLFATAIFVIDLSDYALESIGIAFMFIIISWLALMPVAERKLLFFIETYLIKRFKIFERFYEQLTELIVVSDLQYKKGIVKLSFFQSFLVVLSAALSVYFTMLSLGMTVTWYQGFYCIGLFSLFQLIPLQGIAGIGTQAAWWSFAIIASGYETNDAIMIGFMLHIIFLLFILLMFIPTVFHFLAKRYINSY